MNQAIIQIENLSVQLSGNNILSEVSFAVNAGEYCSIVGPNGAGKTTLIKCLAGIHKKWSGSVRIDGKPANDYKSRELATLQSYVPQAEGRTFPLSVEEFVAMGRYPYQSAFSPLSADDHRAIDAALEQAGLANLRARSMDTLSGGERQMAFIAAALAQETQILLLDEPSTFLDYRHQANVAALLNRACREQGKTVVAVHHDINTALSASHRILALKNGATAFLGTPEEIIQGRTLETIFETAFVRSPSPERPLPLISAGGAL
ncbi:MAG: ABC transporter ATP-binding protein [Pontiellaceae bacterium]|nr:ABC transporter ATP-binding protein [Pontiellaceae bacterium]